MEIFMSLLLLALGFAMLVKGADWFVEGASGIAERFGIPQLVIGLTIVAMGTSAPEAAVSIMAALRGSADITIGNIVGSNILNVLIILGLSAVIVPLAVSGSTIRCEIPFMIGITFLLLALGMDGTVGLSDGILLLLVFLVYFGYLFFMTTVSERKRPKEISGSGFCRCRSLSGQGALKSRNGTGMGGNGAPAAAGKKRKLWQSVLGTLTGLVLIVIGSNAAVDAAGNMARIFGMSERFIGLTIVALGTSLPELFTSVTAARKGNADIAIGNIVGSNIFNILFVVGISALIVPVPFSPGFIVDVLAAAGAGILLLICSVRCRTLGRMGGLAMLLGYLAYFIFLCL